MLTRELVLQAIEIALPLIRALCKAGTWGPLGVAIAVQGPGLRRPVVYVMDELGAKKKKPPKWEGYDWRTFRGIALRKLRTASHGATSFEVFTQMPWLLRPGDEMRRGGINLNGLRVAASGVQGETDQTISWIVAHTLAGPLPHPSPEVDGGRDQDGTGQEEGEEVNPEEATNAFPERLPRALVPCIGGRPPRGLTPPKQQPHVLQEVLLDPPPGLSRCHRDSRTRAPAIPSLLGGLHLVQRAPLRHSPRTVLEVQTTPTTPPTQKEKETKAMKTNYHCPVCGRILCDHTPAERGQTEGEVANLVASMPAFVGQILVQCGGNGQHYNLEAGTTVGDVRAHFARVLSIPTHARGHIRGRSVPDDYVIQLGDGILAFA